MAESTLTPNVVVTDPRVRKVANVILGVALVVFPAAGVLDASSPELDFSQWLIPATAVTSFLAGVFGLVVTTPNVGTKTVATETVVVSGAPVEDTRG